MLKVTVILCPARSGKQFVVSCCLVITVAFTKTDLSRLLRTTVIMREHRHNYAQHSLDGYLLKDDKNAQIVWLNQTINETEGRRRCSA